MRWQLFRLLTLCFWLARASAKSVFLAVRPDAPVGEAKDHGLAMAPARLATREQGRRQVQPSSSSALHCPVCLRCPAALPLPSALCPAPALPCSYGMNELEIKKQTME